MKLGHENSEALDRAFGLLYRCSTAVTGLLARSEVLSFSSEVYEQLCFLYCDLLTLVVDVAVRFYKTVHTSAGTSASLDMYEVFADTITSFKDRRTAITKSIWRDQIVSSGNTDLDGKLPPRTAWATLTPAQLLMSMSLPAGFHPKIELWQHWLSTTL